MYFSFHYIHIDFLEKKSHVQQKNTTKLISTLQTQQQFQKYETDNDKKQLQE